MRKRVLKSILLGLSILAVLPNATYAKERPTKLFINGQEMWNSEVILKKDTTYVPLRIVGEKLGAQVIYDNKNKHIVINKENTSLEMNIGKSKALLNGKEFILSNEILLHTTIDKEQLAYVPLRNIFDVFDGAVEYNKEHKYVNAYNKDHPSYNALQGLKSNDLTTYRFAQIALPRIGEEGMSVNGGRVTEFIFPLDKKVDYFFVRIDPSGDMDVTSMAYMEVENGVAVCKWYKEVRGDVYDNINPLDNVINTSLGSRGITEEIGEFPDLEETDFITFTRHSMMQPDPGNDYVETYKGVFEGMISILTDGEITDVSEVLVEETLWSPYGNDILLSRVNEGKIMIQ